MAITAYSPMTITYKRISRPSAPAKAGTVYLVTVSGYGESIRYCLCAECDNGINRSSSLTVTREAAPAGSRCEMCERVQPAKATKPTYPAGTLTLPDGYRAEPYQDRPGVYAVYQPEGKEIGRNQALWYDCDTNEGTCQCSGFIRWHHCRHLRDTVAALNADIADALKSLGDFPAPRPLPGTAEYRRMLQEDFS